MTGALIAMLLAIMVAAIWLGCAGFARLRAPLDRLHCVAFVNATAGGTLTLAAFLSDGPSTRAFKILLITVISLTAGAALSHASGRAIWFRDNPARSKDFGA